MEVWSNSSPRRFTPGKEHLYQFNRRLGGPQGQSLRFREEKSLLTLPGFEYHVVQPVAKSLYRLGYPGSVIAVTFQHFSEGIDRNYKILVQGN